LRGVGNSGDRGETIIVRRTDERADTVIVRNRNDSDVDVEEL